MRQDLGFSDNPGALPMTSILSSPESEFNPMFHFGGDVAVPQSWHALGWH